VSCVYSYIVANQLDSLTPFVALRLLHLSPENNADPDEPSVMASIFTEACMQIGFILATMTCLKPLLRPFHSGYLITTADTNLSGYKTGIRGRKGSEYLMLSAVKDNASTKPATTATTVSVADPPDDANTQPAPPSKAFIPERRGSHRSPVVRHERLNGSTDSEQMFISKTQTWTVEYEGRSRSERATAAPSASCSSDEGHEHS
jgi:hypothetical protein